MKTQNHPDSVLARRQLLQVLAAATAASTLPACEALERSDSQHQLGPIDRAREASALNTLLVAEYTLLDAYAQSAVILTDARDAPWRPQEERDLAALALALATEFQQDHEAHAALLSTTVTNLGGTAVREDDARFTPPPGFRPSVGNVLKLAANEERRAAIALNRVLKGLQTPEHRFILASIEGVDTQHFMVLKALIDALVDVTPALDTARVVPQPFVSSTESLGGGSGLEALPLLAVNDAN
ncbi:ferritin-like domain-containing protein [Myxococcus qinghaiensis]|uniref:ferritin-like domain-containing protein n=1 Tax=Myxococcus qinghaiensis TaxID=2906758 RepID=UPI0020A75523|nr:ferritin-like domain-containing protein [Myxococcus qinghaiensis]MCP3166001.1 ferritin-like domain-containing protein [Myxococcus qinghaiensis]